MKNSGISIIGFICWGLLTFSMGYRLSKKYPTPVIEEKVAPAERPYNKTLLLVHRDHKMKKGQFVYISGIENEYLTVKKLEAENFPPPETTIYVVHSFHNHFYMYIKRL